MVVVFTLEEKRFCSRILHESVDQEFLFHFLRTVFGAISFLDALDLALYISSLHVFIK